MKNEVKKCFMFKIKRCVYAMKMSKNVNVTVSVRVLVVCFLINAARDVKRGAVSYKCSTVSAVL